MVSESARETHIVKHWTEQCFTHTEKKQFEEYAPLALAANAGQLVCMHPLTLEQKDPSSFTIECEKLNAGVCLRGTDAVLSRTKEHTLSLKQGQVFLHKAGSPAQLCRLSVS